MSNTKTALKLALEALEISLPARCADQTDALYLSEREKHGAAITALRQAIEQAEQAQPAAQPMAKVVSTAPERVWLDLGFDPADEAEISFSEIDDVTWSHDNATGYGIEYIRADLAQPPRQPLTDDHEREAFEDYAVRTICNPVELQRKRLSGYGSEELNYLWRGWKARAAHGITGVKK